MINFDLINVLIDDNLLIHLDSEPSSFILFGFKKIDQGLLNVNILAFKRLNQNWDSSAVRCLVKERNLPKVLGVLDVSSSPSSYSSSWRSSIEAEAGKTFFVHLVYDKRVTVKEILVNGKDNETLPINLLIYNSHHLLTSSTKFYGPIGLDKFEEPIYTFCIQTVEKYSLQKKTNDRFQVQSFIPCVPIGKKGTKISNLTQRVRSSCFDHFLEYTTTGRLMYHRFEESLFCWNNFNNKQLTIRVVNILSLITVDLVLSFLFFLILSQVTSPSNLLEACIQIMESIVSEVEQLIYNLIGMPAGLKLNRPLNTALGNFFLYHIHIWKAYITLIRPFLSLVLDLLGFISFFGITFVLSFFSDLISLASIHIYCFYGYAARLYCFQLSGLISLWRLFRGKKWNNLKHRVDSYSYGHDQLFIGTVCFTILIFLLPTILLYYTVFLFLRLINIISQFIIKLAIGVILSIPFYGLLLWIIGSPKIKTNIFFRIVNIRERQLTVHMIFKPMTLGQIFESHTRNFGNPFCYQKLLPINFFLSIMTGSLI